MEYENKTSKFRAWQPSTWPDDFDIEVIGKIFKESIIDEIENVINDVQKNNGNLEHRGHVITIALMCALDSISYYGYRGEHVRKFIENHFPDDYGKHASDIYEVYRCSMIHNWNLFEARLYPGHNKITKEGGVLSFGVINFFDALKYSVKDFLEKLESDKKLQNNTLSTYKRLKKTAQP